MAKSWLVTGAASGIGAAVVRMAASRGDSVLALDVNDDDGSVIADEVGATYMNCDVSSPDAWAQVAASITEPLDYVHLNAGIQIAPPDAPLSEYRFEAMQLERYRRMMGVNVDGVVFGLQALLPHIQSGGAVTVTASLAGVVPYDVDPLYSMSKHAVVGLVRSLGAPLERRNIRINALCPGGIDTAIIPEAQRIADAVFMTPEQVALEVLFIMETEETGKTWAKVREDKPVFIIRAPGDKSRGEGGE